MSEELKYQGHGIADWQMQNKMDWEEVEHASWLVRKAQEMADKAVKKCQESTRICVALAEGRLPGSKPFKVYPKHCCFNCKHAIFYRTPEGEMACEMGHLEVKREHCCRDYCARDYEEGR